MAEWDNISFKAVYWKMQREYRQSLQAVYDMDWWSKAIGDYPYCRIGWDALYPFNDDDERITYKGYYSMVK